MENEEVVVEATEKKGVQAKPVSLWGQILAAVWIAGWSVWKFIKGGESIEITDVIFSGLAIVGCFSPVYFSILLDKIKEIRFGK